MLSKPLDKKEKEIITIINLFIIFLVSLSYLFNTIYIKPQLNENDNWFFFFMINYFNDIGAGVMIAAFANLLFILKRKRCVLALKFYLFLSLLECIIWEFVRPFILIVFNPFNKSPKFLWGDMIAYTIGTLFVYLTVYIAHKKLTHECQNKACDNLK